MNAKSKDGKWGRGGTPAFAEKLRRGKRAYRWLVWSMLVGPSLLAQLPALPGTKAVVLSPKGAELSASLGARMIVPVKTVAASVANHLPPMAVIQISTRQGALYPVDASLTN